MKVDAAAILDSCVLVPMPLADTMLRLAETPRHYRPRWSNSIIAEVTRTLTNDWKKTPEQAKRREDALRAHFPEAWVEGYERIVPAMTNDPKDRHVLAAAVNSGVKLIVTYNAKHFPAFALEPWGIERQGPSTFLMNLYRLEPDIVLRKLNQQAENIGVPLKSLLLRLKTNVPAFFASFCQDRRIYFDEDEHK